MLFKCSLRIVGHPHVPSCVESGFPLIFLFTWSSWRLLRPLGKTNPAIHLYPKWGRNLFGFSGSVQTPGIVWTSFCLLFQRGRLIAFIRFSKGSATASRSTPLPPTRTTGAPWWHFRQQVAGGRNYLRSLGPSWCTAHMGQQSGPDRVSHCILIC